MMSQKNNLVAFLSFIALVALVVAYFSPIWWVSLTAPNYPPEAFPDGIRIHFHFDGVFNGCKAAAVGTRMADEIIQKDLGHDDVRYNPILDAKKEIHADTEGLDCVHEMNTINHYVGMFPISTGAPVERPLAKFFFGFFAIMIIAFAVPSKKIQLFTLGFGFLAVAAWMLVDQYAFGRLDAHVQQYMHDAGAFFKEPDKIAVWGGNVRLLTHAVVIGLMLSMAAVVVLVAKFRRFQLVLALVPALLPLFFVLTYAGWLWFFGHNLHPWGAFTVKPFMPTLFGEGKVAQFSTYSYPYWGYGLLVIVFVCLMLALLIRRKQMREDHGCPTML